MLSEFPQPDPDALEHSARLVAHIKEHILAAGGWISFADYMNLVLYAPGMGYWQKIILKIHLFLSIAKRQLSGNF